MNFFLNVPLCSAIGLVFFIIACDFGEQRYFAAKLVWGVQGLEMTSG